VGTWGVGVFDDDLALDVQRGFRELIAAGFSSEEATQRLLAEYEFEDDPSEIQAGWIALAVTQWKTGRPGGDPVHVGPAPGRSGVRNGR
jgi:hypothetical protein